MEFGEFLKRASAWCPLALFLGFAAWSIWDAGLLRFAKFMLLMFTFSLYTALGPPLDPHHNPGFPFLLFSSCCLVGGDHDRGRGFDGKSGEQVLWAIETVFFATMIGGSSFAVVKHTPDKTTSAWLLLWPLSFVYFGLPMLDDYLRGLDMNSSFRAAAALVTVGVFVGHFSTKTSGGRVIYQQFERLWPPTLLQSTIPPVLLGAAIMFYFSQALLLQPVDQQARYPIAKLDDSPPVSHIPIEAIAWACGLALCSGSVNNAPCRAILASVSITTVLSAVYVPPLDNLLGLEYRMYILVLYGIEVVTAFLCVAFHSWTVCFGWEEKAVEMKTQHDTFRVDVKNKLPA